MTKTYRHPVRILILLGVGGPLVIALTWFLYLGVYLTIESLFYATRPQEVPVDQIRQGTAIGLTLIGYLMMRSKANALFKALIIMSPISMVVVTLLFRVIMNPTALILTLVGFTGVLIVAINLTKLPWFFYVAVGLSILISTIYAWPQ
jgi:hypothetical protein